MTVEVNTTHRQVEKVVKVSEKLVTLTLDEKTATFIAVLAGSIKGNPTGEIRKITRPVYHALQDAGFGIEYDEYNRLRDMIIPASDKNLNF